MDDKTLHQNHFQYLPPEVVTKIFEQTNATDLARSRIVCGYWRNIIEALHITRLEMDNNNWQAYVTKSTASKIHLKLNSVQYPIYDTPEFINFASRICILEITGSILKGNIVHLLRGCRKLKEFSIDRIRWDQFESAPNFNMNANEPMLQLTQFNIGSMQGFQSLSTVTNPVGVLLKWNCMKTLKLSSVFLPKNVLKLIFAEVLGERAPTDEPSVAIETIVKNQSGSLTLIVFDYHHVTAEPATPRVFLKLHPRAGASSSSTVTPPIQIDELRLGNNQVFSLEVKQMLLKIFATQCRMKNLKILYNNEADLQQIEKIVSKNYQTLKEIIIRSLEANEETFRLMSCSYLEKCLTLKELTFYSENRKRKVKLLDILRLPTSLTKLYLTGFVPTGSSEMFGVSGLSLYLNLTEIVLAGPPWFIQDEIPVTVFETSHLHWLLNLFSQIRLLRLVDETLQRNVTAVFSNFAAWCRQGGRGNVNIESFHVSFDSFIAPNNAIGRSTIYSIVIVKR